MSALRAAIPSNVAILLSAKLQQEIVTASLEAEHRIDMHERTAEQAAQALQWIDNEMLTHVLGCTECRFRACRSMRAMRRAAERADRSYRRALKRLNGGR